MCHVPSQLQAPRKTGRLVKEPELENRPLCDQQTHPALALSAARPELFAAQGTVAASRRGRGSQSYGPYYRLTYRDGGRQSSIYLGRDGSLVERVRRALAALPPKSPSTCRRAELCRT
jgi:hypothetical protein